LRAYGGEDFPLRLSQNPAPANSAIGTRKRDEPTSLPAKEPEIWGQKGYLLEKESFARNGKGKLMPWAFRYIDPDPGGAEGGQPRGEIGQEENMSRLHGRFFASFPEEESGGPSSRASLSRRRVWLGSERSFPQTHLTLWPN